MCGEVVVSAVCERVQEATKLVVDWLWQYNKTFIVVYDIKLYNYQDTFTRHNND